MITYDIALMYVPEMVKNDLLIKMGEYAQTKDKEMQKGIELLLIHIESTTPKCISEPIKQAYMEIRNDII